MKPARSVSNLFKDVPGDNELYFDSDVDAGTGSRRMYMALQITKETTPQMLDAIIQTVTANIRKASQP